MHASGSSGARVPARRWCLTVLPCMAHERWWTMRGGGSTEVSSRGWTVSQPIARVLLRRLRPYRHACAAARRTAASQRQCPWRPSDRTGPRHCRQRLWSGSFQGAGRWARHHRHTACFVRRTRVLAVRRLMPPTPRRTRAPACGNPRPSPVPCLSVAPAWPAGFLHARTAVCVGGLVQPERANRLGRTALLVRASASRAPPRTHASAQRLRTLRPCRRGGTSGAHQAARP